MLLCNIALSRWLYIRFPSVKLWSYVDNLELTGTSIADVNQGLQLMTQFCDLLDLQLDEAETYFWSNDAADRQAARQSNLMLQASARDLGAHMEYGLRKTNHILQKRVQAMPRIWTALAKSPAPYRQKVEALRVKGWPQALSAVSSASLGDTHVRSLRTGACRGLRVHAPGISPMAHLSLVEHPSTDPACAMLVDTVFTLRRHACPDRVSDLMDRLIAVGWDTPPRPGPCHVLLERLHSIGWSWLGQGWVLDHEQQPLALLHGTHSEVHQRLEWVHAGFTLERFRTHNTHKQGLLRKILNGTFFTADTQAHNDKAHTLPCKFCGQPDSQFHRFWECKSFDSARPHPWLTAQLVAGGMPKCLTFHGWMGLPASVRELQKALVSCPDTTDSFEQVPFQPRDLFLDGSCVNPTCQFTRIAGWGIVVAHPEDTDQWWPLAQGRVPGRRLTSGRAEILAAISALRFVLRHGYPVRLWCDNAQVVHALQQALHRPAECKIGRKDSDLWSLLVSLARTMHGHLVTVHKIASHQHRSNASWIEQWAFQGNDNADHCARWSTLFPQPLHCLWQQATQDIHSARLLRDQVHHNMLRVSEEAVSKDPPPQAEDPPQPAFPLPIQDTTLAPLPNLPQTCTHKLVGEGWSLLTNWSQSLHNPTAEAVHVPWFFLLIDFVLHTGSGGIRASHKFAKWHWLTKEEARQFKLVDRVKWFRLFLIRVHKLEGQPLHTTYVRPSTRQVVFWAHCLCFRTDPRLRRIEEYIGRFKAVLLLGREIADLEL